MLYFWAALCLIGLVGELLTGALVGIWIAAAALVAGGLTALGLPAVVSVPAFAVLGIVLLAAVRPLAVRQRAGRLPAEALLGKLGAVADAIDEQFASGRVIIEGTPYVARCRPGQVLAAGATARVAAVEAGELIVERA